MAGSETIPARGDERLPEVETPAVTVRSRYSLVVLAAKRAKQIREGAPVLIETESTNTLTIALEEIAAGKINSVAVEEPADGEGGRASHAEASVSPASPFLVDELVNASIARNREADGYLPEPDEDEGGAADEDSMDGESGNDGEE